MWFIYTKEYYSATKRNEIVPFAEMWMYLEIVKQTKVSQRKTNIVYQHTHTHTHTHTYIYIYIHMEFRKMIYMSFFAKQE